MTQTVEQDAQELPLHMRRDGFDPVPELAALREDEGVRLVTTPLRLPGLPGHPPRRCPRGPRRPRPVQQRRPAGFELPGAPAMSEAAGADAGG